MIHALIKGYFSTDHPDDLNVYLRKFQTLLQHSALISGDFDEIKKGGIKEKSRKRYLLYLEVFQLCRLAFMALAPPRGTLNYLVGFYEYSSPLGVTGKVLSSAVFFGTLQGFLYRCTWFHQEKTTRVKWLTDLIPNSLLSDSRFSESHNHRIKLRLTPENFKLFSRRVKHMFLLGDFLAKNLTVSAILFVLCMVSFCIWEGCETARLVIMISWLPFHSLMYFYFSHEIMVTYCTWFIGNSYLKIRYEQLLDLCERIQKSARREQKSLSQSIFANVSSHGELSTSANIKGAKDQNSKQFYHSSIESQIKHLVVVHADFVKRLKDFNAFTKYSLTVVNLTTTPINCTTSYALVFMEIKSGLEQIVLPVPLVCAAEGVAGSMMMTIGTAMFCVKSNHFYKRLLSLQSTLAEGNTSITGRTLIQQMIEDYGNDVSPVALKTMEGVTYGMMTYQKVKNDSRTYLLRINK
jgi:hypothetical protein